MLYNYRAKSLEGKEESGSLEAANEKNLADKLRQKGYFLVSLEKDSRQTVKPAPTGEQDKKRTGFDLGKLNFLSKLLSVSLAEKLFFTRNLTVMIESGIALPRAFEVLSQQAKSGKFKKILKTVSSRIIKGETLSKALASFPRVFPKLYQETIKVGEETGKLCESLKMLAEQMEREHTLKSRIQTAMTYPLVVLAMAILIGVFMFLFAVPKLKTAFIELKVDLPLSTKIIFALADFLSRHWPLAILAILVLVIALFAFFRTGKGGKFKSTLALRIPVLSKIIKETNSVLTLRTLGSLMKAGVPVVRALNLTAGSLSNFYFKQSLIRASKVVEKGERISRALQPYQALYSPMVLQMIEVGEETGETPQILEKLADFYEEEVSNTTQKLAAMVEPFMIVIVGAGVGFFAVSMMQPMFSMMGGV